ncbi:MAG: DUF362 domain-containing protein [candidate division KSB1 bacterium]|nr:DUF362 domain-containing protein [candidate division KSB1 bacterium]
MNKFEFKPEERLSYKIDRRNFLRSGLLLSSGALFAGLENCNGDQGKAAVSSRSSTSSKSKIVIARNDLVRNAKGKLDSEQVGKLLDEALRSYYGITSLDQIWRKIVRPDDVVGIKVNCLAGKGISSSPELVAAIVEGVQRAGVRANRIVIWDRLADDLERAGFSINTGGGGVRCYGNDQAGYTNDIIMSGSIGSLLSRTVTDHCSAIINVPILKDHGIVGVTIALKNFFGAIHNPNKYHHNAGDPYIADVNLIPAIRNKVRITICDALTCQYEGGPPYMPQWSWNYNGLLVGQDMVALDHLGWQIIEEKRKEKGLPSLKEVGREPTYIATAADQDHRLGTNDPNKMEVIRI